MNIPWISSPLEELRKARLKADMTQEQLAHEEGVSRQYVSLLELNEKSPMVDVLLRICRALGALAGRKLLKVERS